MNNNKMLELLGFGLIGGTIYAYLGLISQRDPLGWPIFWICAGGALAIIVLKKKRSDPNRTKKNEKI